MTEQPNDFFVVALFTRIIVDLKILRLSMFCPAISVCCNRPPAGGVLLGASALEDTGDKSLVTRDDAFAGVGLNGALRARSWGLPAGEDGVVDEGDETGCHDDAAESGSVTIMGLYREQVKRYLLANVSLGFDDRFITDPDMTRRHPSADLLIPLHLLQSPHLRHDMRNRTPLTVSNEMIRHRLGMLINHPAPGVRMTPPLEDVQNHTLFAHTVAARDVDASVVAELEFDGVGGLFDGLCCGSHVSDTSRRCSGGSGGELVG